MAKVIYVTKPSPLARQVESDLRKLLKNKLVAGEHDIIIAIGGDGTILQAIRKYCGQPVRFVGISAGSLGFLQTVERDELKGLASALEAESYATLEAPLLGLRQPGDSAILYGFNDISIERAGARAAKFTVQVGESTGHFIGDGVIFSTPLGSTAYALAAGGPIIDALANDVFLVTPNNPHVSSLYSSLQRPHILAGERVVKLQFTQADIDERPLQLICDGMIVPLDFSQELEIFLSRNKVELLELSGRGLRNHIETRRLGRS